MIDEDAPREPGKVKGEACPEHEHLTINGLATFHCVESSYCDHQSVLTMTNMKPLVLCFCLQAIVVMITIPVSHCRTFLPNNGNLIDSTCKKTPNYNLCLQYLKASPGSSSADVSGLALIMVKVMKAKVNDGLKRIHDLQKGGAGPNLKKALSSCADSYNSVLTTDIPEATEALQKGNPKFAQDGANDAANEANYCEEDFSGHSPLTQQNNALHDSAAITSAIIRLLL
ncbi:unnamed protein product [Sphenostylis stenocarpa]|uniref:Pectinesterase inhibitor domain-containing protein n=1 Tax=Sphenostylis stenocarpa TaxID=92480 RepID=A0AA86VG03_9FABA|nr:unnamed protein product [Sphenostylis stenocarpa]